MGPAHAKSDDFIKTLKATYLQVGTSIPFTSDILGENRFRTSHMVRSGCFKKMPKERGGVQYYKITNDGKNYLKKVGAI